MNAEGRYKKIRNHKKLVPKNFACLWRIIVLVCDIDETMTQKTKIQPF
jgi:hypothetical protein